MSEHDALELIRIVKRAEEHYTRSLSPDDTPVTPSRVNWSYFEKVLEQYMEEEV